jgi:hypothetical protein
MWTSSSALSDTYEVLEIWAGSVGDQGADASYGVHVDGRSQTGSCVVIGDLGAVHCRSSKQTTVTKNSTEAALVGLSDSANQGILLRNFLRLQMCSMPAVIM